MSIRQRTIAQVAGIAVLVVSVAAVTSMPSTEGANAQATRAAKPDAHVFVPTGVALPSHDDEPAPTF
jgi:hypothetical protein